MAVFSKKHSVYISFYSLLLLTALVINFYDNGMQNSDSLAKEKKKKNTIALIKMTKELHKGIIYRDVFLCDRNHGQILFTRRIVITSSYAT